MRKEILLPAIAVVGGGAGFALRRWELATAFEADTGLPISGAPATMALIALSVVVAAVLLILSFMGKYPRFSGYDQAFSAKDNTLYAMAGILSGFLLIGAGGLMAYDFATGANPIYTRLIVAVLAVALVGGGAAFYFKVLRPKQQKAAEPQEDYGDELTDYDGPDGYGDEDDDGPPWDEEDEDGEEADK